MTRSLSIIRALLRQHFTLATTYRAEMVLWALSGTLPIIMMGLWSKAAASGAYALSSTDMVRYFVAVLFVRQMTFVWVIWEFEREVVKGELSFALLRPMHPVWPHLASHVSERLVRLPIVFLLIGLCFVLFPEAAFMPRPMDLLVGFFITICAFFTRFVMQFTSAMLCFFTERASSIEGLMFLLYMFLSGAIAPLDVFPESVRQFASYTPFPYFVYLPARILVGQPAPILQGLATMFTWGGAMLLVQRWAWRRGTRRYSAMGA